MQKSMIQTEHETLRLDFFPQKAEVGPIIELHTELSTAKGEILVPGYHRDVRAYVQCDCACK
jgi:hypothetical protein